MRRPPYRLSRPSRSYLPLFIPFAVGALLALSGLTANAIPLIGNPSASTGNSSNINGPLKAAGFQTPSSAYVAESLDLRLENVSPGENVLVRLYASNAAGTAPATTDGAAPLATFVNPVFPNSTSPANYNFTLAAPFALTPSTEYWIVVSAGSGANFIWNNASGGVTPTSSVGFTNLGFRRSTDGGASYEGSTVLNTYQLNGFAASNAPEPGSLALVGLAGLPVLGAVARRRKG